jgi:undecaprenyl-diphosphatase
MRRFLSLCVAPDSGVSRGVRVQHRRAPRLIRFSRSIPRFDFMQNFNLAVFTALNAGSTPLPAVAHLAVFCAKWLVFVVPLLLALTWALGATHATRRQAIEAGLAACAALALAQLISACWYSPRPFVAGVGAQLIPHAPDGSFPSNHMTFVWSITAGLLLARTTRVAGVALVGVALAVAWGRIYAGVHWPLDMVGGVLVGTAGALLVHLYARGVTALIDRTGETLHARLFGRTRAG